MPLVSIGAEPIPGLGFLSFLWLPSRKQTEKARQKAKESGLPKMPLVQAFIEGRLTVGTVVTVKEVSLVLKGVYSDSEFPEAFVFWNQQEGRYIQFYMWEYLYDFQIAE